jgi:hypothetical protein
MNFSRIHNLILAFEMRTICIYIIKAFLTSEDRKY